MKSFYRTKYTLQKMFYFFFEALQLITVLLLVCDFYMSWSTSLLFLSFCVEFSISDSISFLLGFIFYSVKSTDFLALKRHNSFQIQNYRNATHSFAPRSLIYKLEKEIQKYMRELELTEYWPSWDELFKCKFISRSAFGEL